MIQTLQNTYAVLDERYPMHTKIVRFLISGGVATGIDLVLLYVFTDIFGVWYLASSILAFVLAFFVSFGLQKFWTFRDHSREGIQAQAGIYFLIAAANLGLNTLLVYLLVDYANLHYLIAQIIVSAGIAVENFFVYQRFIFRTSIV